MSVAAAKARLNRQDGDPASGFISKSDIQSAFDDLNDAITASAGVNVRDYGAVGDNTTDDTDAIQDAIDAAQGTKVIFPPGRYRCLGALTIPAYTSLQGSMTESGPDPVAYTELIFPTTAGNPTALTCGYYARLSDLVITGSNNYDNTAKGITAPHVYLRDVVVRGFATGVHLTDAWYAYFDHVELLNCPIGVKLTDCYNVTMNAFRYGFGWPDLGSGASNTQALTGLTIGKVYEVSPTTYTQTITSATLDGGAMSVSGNHATFTATATSHTVVKTGGTATSISVRLVLDHTAIEAGQVRSLNLFGGSIEGHNVGVRITGGGLNLYGVYFEGSPEQESVGVYMGASAGVQLLMTGCTAYLNGHPVCFIYNADGAHDNSITVTNNLWLSALAGSRSGNVLYSTGAGNDINMWGDSWTGVQDSGAGYVGTLLNSGSVAGANIELPYAYDNGPWAAAGPTTAFLGRSQSIPAGCSYGWASSDVRIHHGAGTPEGAVVAAIGSTYHRTDGGAGTSFYVKESGTGNTGWVAK